MKSDLTGSTAFAATAAGTAAGRVAVAGVVTRRFGSDRLMLRGSDDLAGPGPRTSFSDNLSIALAAVIGCVADAVGTITSSPTTATSVTGPRDAETKNATAIPAAATEGRASHRNSLTGGHGARAPAGSLAISRLIDHQTAGESAISSVTDSSSRASAKICEISRSNCSSLSIFFMACAAGKPSFTCRTTGFRFRFRKLFRVEPIRPVTASASPRTGGMLSLLFTLEGGSLI